MKIRLTGLILFFITHGIYAQQFGTFEDSRDGKVYKTVKIGEQIWFAENLAYKVNGDSSENEYDPGHVAIFGRMYTWEDALNACPAGWRLPDKDEFERLLQNLGGAGSNSFHQLIPSGDSGFLVLFGGWRNHGGGDGNVGNYSFFWSSTQDRSGRAWTLNVYGFGKRAVMHNSYLQSAYSNTHGEYFGFSVRCIRDN